MSSHHLLVGRAGAAQAGFSLPEVMVATAILATALVSLGQLFAISMVSNRGARCTTYAAMLASQKIEELRSLAYSELTPSPPGTLGVSTSAYADYLDTYGRAIGGGGSPPAGTVYIRRWSIEPLPAYPDNTLVLQVLVTDLRAGAAPGSAGRMPHEARLVTLRTRKAS